MSNPDPKPEAKRTEESPAILVEWLTDAEDATTEEHNLGLLDALKLCPSSVFWSLAMSTAIIMEGYDTMLVGNLFAQPAFQKRYGQPSTGTSYEISAPWQAGLNNGSAIGQLFGLLAAGYISERLGFRKTMMVGLAVITGLIFITFFASSLQVLLAGQILFGIPLGLFQTTPVIYAMEISPASLRPYLTTYVNFCWAIGHLIGAGILRGVLPMEDQWAYRIPFAIQWFWPVLLIPLLYFAPESPWWLVRQGRLEEAKGVLRRLTSGGSTAFSIDKQVALMMVTTEHERTVNDQTSYTACFRGADLRRTLIVMGIYCIQTFSGNPLRGYSTYFLQQAGLPSTQAFNMTIVGYSLALVGGFFTWVLLPVFGRRSIFFWSLVMMLVLMVLIGGLGVPQATSQETSYAWAIGSLLIISSFLYNCSMGTLTNTLCAEIPSALLRSKSVVLARWSYAVTTIAANALTPYQLNKTAWNWGAKTGFFWAGGCLLSAIFAYFCVPETKGRTTAEIDVLFERKVSPRHFAQTPVDLTQAISGQDEKVV
ncbi:sugar transporter [Thozetella sp. PMI_491]|nr:sugar transporter [Thozetella sp. PMI_491]